VTATRRSARRSRRRSPLPWLYGLALGARLPFALHVHEPIIFADEAGPLLVARTLVGHTPRPTLASEPLFHIGYPLLVAPWTALLGPSREFRGATLTNAFLLATIALLVLLVLRDGLGVGQRPALAIAAVTSLYPSFLLETGFTWTESATITAVLLTFVTCQRLTRSPSRWSAVAFGASTAAAYAVHPRLVPLVALTPVVIFLVRRWHGLSTVDALTGLATTAGLFLLTRAAHAWITATLYTGEPVAGEKAFLNKSFHSPESLFGALGALAGQTWYLTVATLGLAPLGGALLLSELRRKPRRVDLLYFVVVTAALLALSSLFVHQPNRVDQRVYGRYAEPVLALLLAAGLVALWRHRHPLRIALVMMGFPLTLCALLLGGVGRHHFGGVVNPANLLGIDQFVLLRPRVGVGRITLYAVLGAALLLGTRLLFRRAGMAVALALLAAYFVVSANRTLEKVLEPIHRTHRITDAVPEAVPRIEALTGQRIRRVDFVHGATLGRETLFTYQLELPDVEFDLVEAPHVPRGPWVMAPLTWEGAAAARARLVFPEALKDSGLWVRPGPELDELERRGILASTSRLAAADLRARVTTPTQAVSLERGKEVKLRLRIENRSRAPWPDTYEKGRAGSPVMVRAEWRNEDDDSVAWANVSWLTHRVLPGETTDVEVSLQARADDASTPPSGRYRIDIALFQAADLLVRASAPRITVSLR